MFRADVEEEEGERYWSSCRSARNEDNNPGFHIRYQGGHTGHGMPIMQYKSKTHKVLNDLFKSLLLLYDTGCLGNASSA
jgi:hypothetical protein